MNLYIDFTTVKEKSALAQAIKVFAMTFKDDEIFVIIDKEKSTLVEEKNIHFISKNETQEFENLYTFNKGNIKQEMVHFAFLKPSSKEVESVIFGDLNNNSYTLEEKYEMLLNRGFITKNRKFALLNSSLGSIDDEAIFLNKHKNDDSFSGIIMPKDIVPKGISNVLTSPTIANIFLDSLYYSIEFLKLKKDDEESSSNIFSKLFSWDKGAHHEVMINTLIHDFELGLTSNKFVLCVNDNMNYKFYYQSLYTFYSLLKLNNSKSN